MPYNIEDELNVIDARKIKIRKDEFNRLKLTIEGGEEYQEIKAVMGFPLTDSDKFVSLFEIKDGKKDKEIGIIEDVGKLDSESKKLIRAELKKEYFMPEITKINSMTETHGVMKFNVETDKGPRAFETRYKEDIRRMPNNRIIIRDADGNRYEIKDQTKLDPRSMNLIDTEI